MDETSDSTPVPAHVATPDSGPVLTLERSCGCESHAATASTAADLAPAPPPGPPTWVYALGRVEARVPFLSVEKELAQAAAGIESARLTDQQVLRRVLSEPANRYLTRHMCWVFTVQGIDTFILRPHLSSDFDLLVEAIREDPGPLDLDAVIGELGPLAPASACNGLVVPMVALDQLYPFDRGSFADAVPRVKGRNATEHAAAVHEVLETILRIADNTGSTDEHRALNYLAMRYAGIYTATAERFDRDVGLQGVAVELSPLGGERRVVDCRFRYVDRRTTFVETLVVSVDVTEEFPFLVAPLRPSFDRP